MKHVVLAAMIEVQVAVEHCNNVAFVDVDPFERGHDRNDVRAVQVVDEGVPRSDSSVEQDHAVRMTDDVTEDGTPAFTHPRMPIREAHLAERKP